MITTETTDLLHQRWQHFFKEIPAGYFKFILNRDGRYQAVQAPDLARLWLTEAEHIGKTIEEVLPPDLAGDRRYYFDKALATGKNQTYVYPHPRYEETRYMQVQITLLPDSDEVLMTVCDVMVNRIPEFYILPR